MQLQQLDAQLNNISIVIDEQSQPNADLERMRKRQEKQHQLNQQKQLLLQQLQQIEAQIHDNNNYQYSRNKDDSGNLKFAYMNDLPSYDDLF